MKMQCSDLLLQEHRFLTALVAIFPLDPPPFLLQGLASPGMLSTMTEQSISAGHTCSEIELLYPEAFVYRIPMILVKTFLEEFYDSSYTVFLPFLLS